MSDAVDIVVLGGGPGGYTAAFRAADLGLSVVLVERYERLGGVCLNVGCIPSKALLHAASLITSAEHGDEIGVTFTPPTIDLDRLRTSTEKVVSTLTGGLDGLARKRKITVLQGTGTFVSSTRMSVEGPEGHVLVDFRHAVIAAGSRPVMLPGLPDDPRIMDSTGALALEEVPDRLVVIGGGIIGLEMATVYDALGSEVTVVEALPQLMTGCDGDLVAPLAKRVEKRYAAVHVDTRVEEVTMADDGLHVRVTKGDDTDVIVADRVLVAVGRRANGDLIAADAAGVAVDERGVIAVDATMRTNVRNVFAIGDITGNPMLAHRAIHQGRVAAEVIAGRDVAFDAQTVPSVAYTDPEVAWMGLTEEDAAERGVEVEVARIPWRASGRALTLGRSEGLTKLITEPGSGRILGAGIVGPNAGELIGELVLALEMGAVAEDIALTIHPHPTLSETTALAAEWIDGSITDLVRPAPRANG